MTELEIRVSLFGSLCNLLTTFNQWASFQSYQSLPSIQLTLSASFPYLNFSLFFFGSYQGKEEGKDPPWTGHNFFQVRESVFTQNTCKRLKGSIPAKKGKLAYAYSSTSPWNPLKSFTCSLKILYRICMCSLISQVHNEYEKNSHLDYSNFQIIRIQN